MPWRPAQQACACCEEGLSGHLEPLDTVGTAGHSCQLLENLKSLLSASGKHTGLYYSVLSRWRRGLCHDCPLHRAGHKLACHASGGAVMLQTLPYFTAMCGCRGAQKMDPQLRKLLEVSYEALLHAGLVIGELPPERCGVYVGCCGSEVRVSYMVLATGSQELPGTLRGILNCFTCIKAKSKDLPRRSAVAVFPEAQQHGCLLWSGVRGGCEAARLSACAGACAVAGGC